MAQLLSAWFKHIYSYFHLHSNIQFTKQFQFNALFILQGFQTALGLLVGLLTCKNLQTFMTIKTTYIYT